MIEVKSWMDGFLKALDGTFPDRVWFVGLQGSYSRGEATETSDIDIVVILDELSAEDIRTYNAMLDTLPHRELICGFLSGKADIMNWDPADLFQFYHDTTPVRGSMEALEALIDADAVQKAIKTGACNIFHGCVHNMLYEKSDEIVKGLYKAASFVVQAVCYQQTGQYIRHQKDLREMVSGEDRAVVDTFIHLKNGGEVRFDEMSETLFVWAKQKIQK